MSHNVSRSRAAATVNASQLSDFTGWHLVVRCDACQRTVEMAIASLLNRLPDGRIGVLVRRLRCLGCGAAPAMIRVERGSRRAVLIGPVSP